MVIFPYETMMFLWEKWWFFPENGGLFQPAAALSIALQHEGLDQLGDLFATEVTENVHLAMGWWESHGVTWGLNLRIAGDWALPIWKMMDWKSVGMMTFPTENWCFTRLDEIMWNYVMFHEFPICFMDLQ
jgi:hypothetical protein